MRKIAFLEDHIETIQAELNSAERFGFEYVVLPTSHSLSEYLAEEPIPSAIMLDMMLQGENEINFGGERVDTLGGMNAGIAVFDALLRANLLTGNVHVGILTERSDDAYIESAIEEITRRHNFPSPNVNIFQKFDEISFGKYKAWLERIALGIEGSKFIAENDETDEQTEAATSPVVLLVHGIRDFALWQNSIRQTLEENGFVAEPLNYGRFNLLKFLAPIPVFRRQAIRAIEKQVEIVVQNNPDVPIHVIAHSFGTYVVSHLMRERFNLRFHRVIFCGSVVPYDFDFEQIQDRFARPIMNEVGTRDIWPALAESVTVGYGSAGTYGFRRPLVRDRWHNGAKHGYFLDPQFCSEFWIPFLRTGEIVKGEDQPESTPIWLNLLHIFKIKYFVALLTFVAVLLVLRLPVAPTCGPEMTATIRQNIVQLERSLIWMSSSEGYSAGNREQWLALLDGFNVGDDEIFAVIVAELRKRVMDAPANDGDNNYNMFVSNEMNLKLQDLRTRVKKSAVECSLSLP